MKSLVKLFLLISVLCSFLAIKDSYCAEKIEIKPTDSGGYSLYVDGSHFLLKGVGYSPTPIGQSYDYQLYTDEAKPWLVDGKLIKDAGFNCIRLYSAGQDLQKVKEFVKDMYEKFGIYTLMSDWIGLWDHPRANYADPEFQNRTKERILKVVEALKDQKGLLMWILGNENNYTFSGKIGFWTSPEVEKIETPYQKQREKARIYYSFIDDIAKSIKEIDKKHPVALGNGEASFLDVAAGVCDDIDLLAIILYRGKYFGNLFNNIKRIFDKPVILSEFGCDSYDAYKLEENQDAQAEFLVSQWKDLYKNTTFSSNSAGNCLGGVIFEWTDEWWKHIESYEPGWSIHNTESSWAESSYFFDAKATGGFNMNEEWFGIVSLCKETENGINKRIPKKAYYVLKDYFSEISTSSPTKSLKVEVNIPPQ